MKKESKKKLNPILGNGSASGTRQAPGFRLCLYEQMEEGNRALVRGVWPQAWGGRDFARELASYLISWG